MPVLVLAAMCAAGAPVLAEEVPKVKPGLWRLTTSGLVGARPTVETRCVRADDESPFAGGPIPGGSCTTPLVERIPAGHRLTMTCTIGDLVMTTVTTATGDPTHRMRFDFVSTATGPSVLPGPGRKRVRSTIRSVRLGDCPPGN